MAKPRQPRSPIAGWTLINERDYDVRAFTPNHPGFTTPVLFTTPEPEAVGSSGRDSRFSWRLGEKNEIGRSFLHSRTNPLHTKPPGLKADDEQLRRKLKSMDKHPKPDSNKRDHGNDTAIIPRMNSLNIGATSLYRKPASYFNSTLNNNSWTPSVAGKKTEKFPGSSRLVWNFVSTPGVLGVNSPARPSKPSAPKEKKTMFASQKINTPCTLSARPTCRPTMASSRTAYDTTSNAAKRADACSDKARDNRSEEDLSQVKSSVSPPAVQEEKTSESQKVSCTTSMTIYLPGSNIDLFDESFCPESESGAEKDEDHKAVFNDIYQRISEKSQANFQRNGETSGANSIPEDKQQSVSVLTSTTKSSSSLSSSSSSRYRRPTNVTTARSRAVSQKHPDVPEGDSLADHPRPSVDVPAPKWKGDLRFDMTPPSNPPQRRTGKGKARYTCRKLGTLRSDHRPETLGQERVVRDNGINTLASTPSAWLYPPSGLITASSSTSSAAGRGRSRVALEVQAKSTPTLMLPVVDFGEAMDKMVVARKGQKGMSKRPAQPTSRWLP